MIETYRFGHIEVDGKSYSKDVIIYPGRVYCPWWREEGHELRIGDIKEALDEKPDLLVIGTGKSGIMKVPDTVKQQIEKRGIQLFAAPTDKSVDYYNRHHISKKVIAALHLTC